MELKLALPGVVGVLQCWALAEQASPGSVREPAYACASLRERTSHASQSHADYQGPGDWFGRSDRSNYQSDGWSEAQDTKADPQWDPHWPSPPKASGSQAMRKEINLQTAPSGLGSRALHLPTSPSVAIWECVVLQLVHPTAARPAIL